MADKEWYITDPQDPEAPVRLEEYRGLREGMSVVYHNPHSTLTLDGPLRLDAVYEFPTIRGVTMVQAVLNDGEYEVNANNLRAEKRPGE